MHANQEKEARVISHCLNSKHRAATHSFTHLTMHLSNHAMHGRLCPRPLSSENRPKPKAIQSIGRTDRTSRGMRLGKEEQPQ